MPNDNFILINSVSNDKKARIWFVAFIVPDNIINCSNTLYIDCWFLYCVVH